MRCEVNSNRFEMSFRGHVNDNNGVTSHQNEISIRFEFTSGLMETCSKSGDLAGMGLHPKKIFATNHGVKHRVYLVTPSFRHKYKYKNWVLLSMIHKYKYEIWVVMNMVYKYKYKIWVALNMFLSCYGKLLLRL